MKTACSKHNGRRVQLESLVVASLAITWFALYALYRLITDES